MPARQEQLTVEISLPSVRLDAFLRDKFPAASRGALQRLIEEGHIRVDGRTVKPSHHPHAGEVIAIVWPEPKAAEAQHGKHQRRPPFDGAAPQGQPLAEASVGAGSMSLQRD